MDLTSKSSYQQDVVHTMVLNMSFEFAHLIAEYLKYHLIALVENLFT